MYPSDSVTEATTWILSRGVYSLERSRLALVSPVYHEHNKAFARAVVPNKPTQCEQFHHRISIAWHLMENWTEHQFWSIYVQQRNRDWPMYLFDLQTCGFKRFRAFFRSELPAFVRSNFEALQRFF